MSFRLVTTVDTVTMVTIVGTMAMCVKTDTGEEKENTILQLQK